MNTIFGFFKEKLLPILIAINSIALVALFTVGTVIVNKLDKLESKMNAVYYSQIFADNDSISISSDGKSLILDLNSDSVMTEKTSCDIEDFKTESTTATVTTTSCTTTLVTETVSAKS